MHELLPFVSPEAELAPTAEQSIWEGGLFQHLQFDPQTCGLAQNCVFTPC